MPKKIRELKGMLQKAGFSCRAGKGSHTIWTHDALTESLVLSGNDGDDAKQYQEKRVRFSGQPGAIAMIHPYSLVIQWSDEDQVFVVSFPELEGYKESAIKKAADGTVQPAVISGDAVLVRVSIPNEAHLKFLLERQFEMVVFVDDRRLFEAEQSAAPFNFRWDVSFLPSGLHYLTINVVSAADHVGTFTAPVEIKREKKPAPDAKDPKDAGPPPP